MTEKQCFIETVENLFKNETNNIPIEASNYLFKLKNSFENKEIITEKGKIILNFLQKHPDTEFKSKEIAEFLQLGSRQISGSMRKLITENFVEKTSIEGVTASYRITDKGKNFKIED